MTDRLTADHSAWTRIDETDQPEFYVRFLAESREVPMRSARADPAAYFASLELGPGLSVLDAACGLGETALALAPLVVPGGRVVGVDLSETMVREARRRAEESNLPVEFRQGDITALDYPNGEFDRTRAEQILQHLPEPEEAVAELVRVTRAGGSVTLSEPDWDSLVVDCDELVVGRAFSRYVGERLVPHGEIGRRLPNLLRDAGLQEVTAVATAIAAPYHVLRDFIATTARRAVADGYLSAETAEAFLADQAERGSSGRFFAGFMFVRAQGRKP